jgi:hypothetical protein
MYAAPIGEKIVSNSHYIYNIVKYPMIGLGIAGLGYYVGGILYQHDLLIELVSKFDTNNAHKLTILKHYILAKDNLNISNNLLVGLVSKFDKNTGYQLAVFKHYVLAQDSFDNIYESMNLEHFGKFLSNSALALGYSAAYIYSKSSDFISGLMPDNLPFSSKADEEYGLFNETYKALENVEDIFV